MFQEIFDNAITETEVITKRITAALDDVLEKRDTVDSFGSKTNHEDSDHDSTTNEIDIPLEPEIEKEI